MQTRDFLMHKISIINSKTLLVTTFFCYNLLHLSGAPADVPAAQPRGVTALLEDPSCLGPWVCFDDLGELEFLIIPWN